MRLYAYVILALCALHARAATIHGPATDLEKKIPIPQDSNKDPAPLENVSSEQELIDSANTIKDVENNLRVKAIESIPVKVIVDEPSVNEVVPDLKYVQADIKNPGPPQRQEHENQTPGHLDHEKQIITAVKQTVSDTQAALKQGFQGVAEGLQNWISNNEQLSSIQQSIQGLQQSFTSQITKLNETIQTYWNNNIALANVNEPEKQPQIETVETHLKSLENNFENGVKALSEGVQVFATLKADNENPTTPQGPAPPNNLFVQYIQLFQQTITQGFNNVTQAIQNYVGQNNNNNGAPSTGLFQGINTGIQNILNQGGQNPPTPAGTQSDDPQPQTPRPTIWQGIQTSIQSILNPGQAQVSQTAQQGGQSQAPATPNRPLAQAIQNLPFVQGVVNLIQPNRPGAQQPSEKPAEAAAQPAAQATQEGSNVLPASTENKQPQSDVPNDLVVEQKPTLAEPAPLKPESSPPKQEPAPPKPEPAVNNNGPIKNIIQNNPIVKGISGAVQRLQASINPNAEKPRDTVKDASEKGDIKGYYGGYIGHGHWNGGPDNTSGNSGVAVKSELVKEVNMEKTVPQEVTKVDEEMKTPVVTDKTDK